MCIRDSHIAAQNKDGGKMLQHILSKLSKEEKTLLLNETRTDGLTPLMAAAAIGDAAWFDVLANLTPNWKANLDSAHKVLYLSLIHI